MASHGTISSTRFRWAANDQPPSKDFAENPGGFCHFISASTDDGISRLAASGLDLSDPDQCCLRQAITHARRALHGTISRRPTTP